MFLCLVGVFVLTDTKLFDLIRPAPFWILHVKSFRALLKFALLISWVNFLEILVIADDVFGVFKSFSILSPSNSDSSISLYVHWSMHCSNAFKWSLEFSFWHGFWRTKLGIVMIALNAVSFIDVNSQPSV